MVALLTAALIAATPCQPPADAVVTKRNVPLSAYYLPSETDGWTGRSMPALPGRTTPRGFWKAVQMNGTGRTALGEWVVIDGPGFRKIVAPSGRFGPLVALETAAANPALFPPGTIVCLPDYGGLTVKVTDTGGGLGSDGPLDIFVGDRTNYEAWLQSGPKQALVIAWQPADAGRSN